MPFNPFSAGKKKKQQNAAKEQLASLGLDPSLFEDPEMSEEEIEGGEGGGGDEVSSFIDSFDAPSKIPTFKPLDISTLLSNSKEDDDDIHVELNEEDLHENSELSRSLAMLALEPQALPCGEISNEQKMEALQAELLESKRAAVFFRQQNLLEEAKGQLVEIRRLNGEITSLQESMGLLPAVAMQKQKNIPPVTVPTPIVPIQPQNDSIKVITPIRRSTEAMEVPRLQETPPGLAMSPIQLQAFSSSEIATSPILYDLHSFTSTNRAQEAAQPEATAKSPNGEPLEPVEPFQPSKIENNTIIDIEVSELDLEEEFRMLGGEEEEEEDFIARKIKSCQEGKEECMEVAIMYKGKKDKAKAIEWLRTAKHFQIAMETLQRGEDFDIDAIKKPEIENEDSAALSPQKQPEMIKEVPLVTEESPEEKERQKRKEEAEKKRFLMFVALETKMKAQAERWKERALSCKASGELHLAVKYHNERKVMTEDIEKITAAKLCPGMPLPIFSKETYTHLKEVHFRNRIETDELEVALVSAKDIKPPSGYMTCDTYISVMVPCAVGEQTWKSQKVANTNSPEFKSVHRFKIERGKRSMVKIIERKKIVFELHFPRWLRADLNLGKCELLISDIKTQAEIIKELPIFNGRRNTGGTLKVRIRVCYPLERKQILEENEDFIVIKKHFPLGSQMEDEPEPEPVMEVKSPVEVIPVLVQRSEGPKKVEQVVEEEEDVDYNAVESMVSNDVLEWALENTIKEIAMYKQKKTEIPEELITRQQQIELKLQLLILQIQTEKMSEEQYIQSVTDKIEEEKKNAKKYLVEKNQKAARFALTRAKIMANELEGE